MERYDTVEAYLAAVDPAKRTALEHIRHVVNQHVPAAAETMSYGMPAFKYKGQPLVYYAAFKDHLSLFPTAGPIEALANKLAGYRISKGTIQFTLEKPLSDSLIRELLDERIKQVKTT